MQHLRSSRARRAALALSPLAFAITQSTHAQTTSSGGTPTPTAAVQLAPVVVTANPLGSELLELAPAVNVLEGTPLLLRRSSTLGETLDGLPGVSATQFGPNASRPVIRGLDADRIRILSNGAAVLDASSLSFDHDVAVDPLVIERAEVVRGPAALLYGGSAVGGVVNVIDNRVPQAPVRGIGGRAELRAGGANREQAAAVVLEGGNGRVAVHADAYTRDTDDLRIPGFARSDRLRAASPQAIEPRDRLPNSGSVAHGGALGASATFDRGYVGVAFSGLEKRYGTVVDPTVTIDMKSDRLDLAGDLKALAGPITGVKFKAGRTDYEHTELEAGVAATRFVSKGHDARLEAQHAKLGPLSGVVGAQITDLDFSALGAEAFVPFTQTDTRALFVFEELPIGPMKLNFGGRRERTEVRNNGGAPRFAPSETRTFDANSGSVGAVYPLNAAVTLATTAAYTQRAPTFYELYANGPHAATGVYEVGDRGAGRETARSLDASVRVKSGAHSGSLTVFGTRFSQFITLLPTGNARGADGEVNPVDADGDGVADGSGEEILPEFAYRGVPARFRGLELEGTFRVLEGRGGSTLDLVLGFDYVRAHNRAADVPLPRIPPRRFSAGLVYRNGGLLARVDAIAADDQSRVAPGELATDGYTLLNAAVSYRLKLPAVGSTGEVFLRATNLLDEDVRSHVSFLKDVAPLGGRAAQIGVRAQF